MDIQNKEDFESLIYFKFKKYDSFKLSKKIVSSELKKIALVPLDDLPDTPLIARLVQRTEKKILALKKKKYSNYVDFLEDYRKVKKNVFDYVKNNAFKIVSGNW